MSVAVEANWREARRERILEAAARTFGRLSFEGASMDDVAAEAGVGKPTLYRYFRGKDELFAAVFAQALDTVEERLEAVLGRDAPIGARLGAIAREIAPIFRDHLIPTNLMGDTAAVAAQSKRRIFRERRVRLEGAITAALDLGARRGELRPLNHRRVAQLAMGMIWSAAASGATNSEIERDVVDLLLHGLLASPGAERPMPAGVRAERNPCAAETSATSKDGLR
ncbi:MAG: TetR/AcrR family transcriptional regulator [Methylobacteriaceae bacterium]|nr:TetR/AcrR family transcriptional regulator [Methylobacteriaceae bacterium]